jgi:murein DD-endopeptidase MepM/ murein hydrolase activator NlpD
VRAVRSLRRAFVSSIAALGLMIVASIAVPAYAQAAAEAELPKPQELSVASVAAVAMVERDAYTVTAPPPLRWPLDSLRIADGFGSRVAPCDGCSTFHEGVDFDPGRGAKVHAIAAGVVVETDNPNYAALGVHVAIEHVIDGKTVVSVYGHMQYGSMTLKVGDEVKVGQVIGLVGSTGASTGPHLHFEIRVNGTTPVDPLAWMHARLG